MQAGRALARRRDLGLVPAAATTGPSALLVDLRSFVQPRIGLDTEELTRQCEQAIRNSTLHRRRPPSPPPDSQSQGIHTLWQ